ncbi:P-II family nitrogen regulator [Sulfurivermis fontis]|jgi:nitrogen regulatory protein PII|uniref:P-II family nitrogen regulator n=1 Tax=Sulfurivermis fontis TaxID=1972068 RepID=UPI000FDC7ADE|nr:P-II family nitrogen regulator [Sulfurivermis fontis]
MHFKLLIALVEDDKTDAVLKAAREAGATGATVVSQARGEGLRQAKTFFGLSVETQRDMVLFLVEEHLARKILEKIAEVGQFDDTPGTGIAFQIDVEDAVGVAQQVRTLTAVVEGEL